LKQSRFERAQAYLWAIIAVVSLGWGFTSALRAEHSQDLRIINTWLRTWLRGGTNPYYLPEVIVANYPPHAIVALSPLALVPENIVAGVWALINLMIAPVVAYLAFRAMRPEATKRALLLPCAMFLAWAGLRTGISNGQFTLLILGFGLLAFMFEEKRPLVGGVFLALALMKPHIGGAFLLWALLTKRWKMSMVACVLMGLGVGIFSLRLMESPLESVRAYLGVLQHQFGRGTQIQGNTALRVVELRPLVALFIHNDAWASRVHQLLLLVLLACVAAVAFVKSRLDSRERDAAIIQLCCLWLLMSVFHNPYDTILLLPVLAGLWAASVPHPLRSKSWQDKTALLITQLVMVLELPGVWWKLSKTMNTDAFNPTGLLFAHVDRLLVLGLFIYILNRVRLYWLAGHRSMTASEMLAQPSTPNT
jgi:hypothetical protein